MPKFSSILILKSEEGLPNHVIIPRCSSFLKCHPAYSR